jgi:nitroreductase
VSFRPGGTDGDLGGDPRPPQRPHLHCRPRAQGAAGPDRGGRLASPTASNRQHWDFVIVTDREQLTELTTVWQGARHLAGAAAAIALVVPEPPDDRTRVIDQYDLGQATFAMMLAATDLGIGTGHSSVGDQDRARAILGVPETHLISFMIGVGYPADRPLRPIAVPDRRPFDEVVHYGHW